jgi:hypothetical protein
VGRSNPHRYADPSPFPAGEHFHKLRDPLGVRFRPFGIVHPVDDRVAIGAIQSLGRRAALPTEAFPIERMPVANHSIQEIVTRHRRPGPCLLAAPSRDEC